MSLAPVFANTALPSAARGTGTHISGPVAGAGMAAEVLVTVHVTAASGTTPTLDVSLEESSDGANWTAVPGSAATQITAVGHRVAAANPTKSFVRVTSTVGGTTPSFTYSVGVWIRSE